MKTKSSDIQTIAYALKKNIQDLQQQIDEKKVLLDCLANICDHPTVEEYRNRRIGKCHFCLHEFSSRSDVDAIFSE